MRFRILPAFALLAAVSCDAPAPTALETPFVPDQGRLDRATVISIDLSANAVSVASKPADGIAMSLVGRDVLDATISNVSRVALNKKKDVVTFDVALTNNLNGVELRQPSLAPEPPNGSSSVFFFPYHIAITGGDGKIEESPDWNGAPFSFFNDIKCRNGRNSDCFPWESLPAPLTPGATSATRRVGFIVEKSVTSFDVYLLTAADLVNVPTGSLEVSVSSAELGPLSAVKVMSGTSPFAITNIAGVATFTGIATGAHSITIEQLPDGCVAPATQSVTVVAGQTAQLSIEVTCVIPEGDASGVVTVAEFGGRAGIEVRLEPGGHVATTGEDGSFSFTGLRAGLYAASVTGGPPSCLTPPALALNVSPSTPATMSVRLDCPAPIVSVSASDVAFNTTATMNAGGSTSPAGAPLSFSWTQLAGAVSHEPGTGATLTYPAGDAPGLYRWRVDVSDGLRTSSQTVEQFVMEQPGAGIFVSPLGDDTFEGTRARPMRTVQAAIDRASPTARDVYVAAGTYETTVPLTVRGSVSLYGGMNPSTWVHESPAPSDASDDKRTVIEGPSRTIQSGSQGLINATIAFLTVRGTVMPGDAGTATAISLTNAIGVTLRDNEVTAADGTGPGASSIGVFIHSSGALPVVLRRNHIKSGAGQRGVDGVMGAAGRPGANATSSFGATPLYPGQNPGGNGGAGAVCSGAPAQPGSAGDAPGGGPNAPGATGPQGSPGAQPGLVPINPFTPLGYVPVTQGPGGPGTHGGSGGGGGGGPTRATGLFGTSCGHGFAGGGGGTGGEGGLGGTSGSGGGISAVIYAGAGQVDVHENTLHSGNGGDGGDAGLGGSGGPGGIGAGSTNGGTGGAGGVGGRGGHGLPGEGGRSIGIVRVPGAQLTQSSNTFTLGQGGWSGKNSIGQQTQSFPIQVFP